MDASNNRPDVFLMSWDQSSRTVQTTSFPDLPAPLAFMGAVLLDGYVYIAGGTAGQDKGHTTNSFYRLNLQGGERQSVGKIGREPCRERVGQAVEISVGGG